MKKIDMTDEQSNCITSLPLLRELLPYRFANGSIIDDLGVVCSCCGNNIHAGDIRARFTPTSEQSAAFIGYGLCFKCRVATPLECRFSDDGSYIAKGEKGWRRGRYTNEKPAGWGGWLKSLFGGR